MKTILKYSMALWPLFNFYLQAGAQTQTTTTTTTTKSKTTTTQKKKTTKLAPPAKDITITIKNLCERTVPIYAGPKEGLKKPKIPTLGGLSTNTLHIKSSDLVCVMSSDGKKTIACVNLKTTTTALEVESSGVEIKSK